MRGRAALGFAAAASLLLCCALLSPSLLQPCAAGRLDSLPANGASSARRSVDVHWRRKSQGRLLHGGIDDGHDDADADSPAAAPSEGGGLQSSTLISNKVGALFVFLAVPLIGCFLPWVLPIPPWLLNYAVLFSAGLFFSLAVEHLLADSAESLGILIASAYPFAYMIFVSGYFLTWLADITARSVWERQEGVRQQRRVDSATSVAGATAGTVASDAAAATTSPLTATDSGKVVCCKSGRVEDVEASGEKGAALTGAQGAGAVERCPGGECKCDGGSCRCTAPSFMEFDTPDAIGRAAETSVYDLNFLEVLLLLLALCFHAVFEGLAVGLSSTLGDVWSITSTVVIHKFLEGIALGTTLLAQNSNRSVLWFSLYALGFSVMAPIGIAIGIILDSTTTPLAASWIEAIGNGLAAGVFVFVAVGHLMVKAMKPQKGDRWWAPFPKWGFAALGVITNSLLMMRSS